MADQSQVVYSRALEGTDKNPGLPDLLAQILVGQSEHESADYSSPVYLATNNVFGYKYTGSKYQRGNYEGYAKYDSVDDSTAELVDYIYRRQADGSFPADLSTITTAAQYVSLLANAKPGPYFGDSVANYTAGVQNWLNTNVFEPIKRNPVTAVAAFGGLFLLAYLLTRRK